jgi:hypothetical protein
VVLLAACAIEGQSQTTAVSPPLAYVRRLALAPVQLTAPADVPLPARPAGKDKAALARWERRRRDQEKQGQRRQLLLVLVEQAVRERLGRLTGLTVVTGGEEGRALSFGPPDKQDQPMPEAATVAQYAQRVQAEAVLVLSIRKMGGSGGLQREEWLSIVGNLFLKSRGGFLPPFYAYGQARAMAPLLRKLTPKDDELLLRKAVDQAAHQIAHFLDTGVEHPFAREVRIAILPADTPSRVEKRRVEALVEQEVGPPELSTARTVVVTGEKAETVLVAVPSLKRQSDVLLQPELGPVAQLVDQVEIQAALAAARLGTADLWGKDGPNKDIVVRLADRLRADYVFVSRITDLDITDISGSPSDEKSSTGIVRKAEAFVEAALFSVKERRVVWHDEGQGGTVAHTEVVRGRSRLRTEEQCTADAARTAYGYLCFRFDDFRSKFER